MCEQLRIGVWEPDLQLGASILSGLMSQALRQNNAPSAQIESSNKMPVHNTNEGVSKDPENASALSCCF